MLSNYFFILPNRRAFAFDVITDFFEMCINILTVFFITNFQKHFDSDTTERRKPHCAAVKYFDDICASFGYPIQKRGKHSGTINNQKFQNYITTFPNQNLFQNPRQQICVNISAAKNGANSSSGKISIFPPKMRQVPPRPHLRRPSDYFERNEKFRVRSLLRKP